MSGREPLAARSRLSTAACPIRHFANSTSGSRATDPAAACSQLPAGGPCSERPAVGWRQEAVRTAPGKEQQQEKEQRQEEQQESCFRTPQTLPAPWPQTRRRPSHPRQSLPAAPYSEPAAAAAHTHRSTHSAATAPRSDETGETGVRSTTASARVDFDLPRRKNRPDEGSPGPHSPRTCHRTAADLHPTYVSPATRAVPRVCQIISHQPRFFESGISFPTLHCCARRMATDDVCACV